MESDPALEESLKTIEKRQGLLWIMVKPEYQSGTSRNEGTLLQTRTFFHTTECAEIPRSVLDLLPSLLRDLRDIWMRNRIKLQDQLMKMVGEFELVLHQANIQ